MIIFLLSIYLNLHIIKNHLQVEKKQILSRQPSDTHLNDKSKFYAKFN